MAQIKFRNKADTLALLQGKLSHGNVLPQVRISQTDWQRDVSAAMSSLAHLVDTPVIVRSSALAEDGEFQSLAGSFDSILDVLGSEALEDAINKVFSSLPFNLKNIVFVQPMLANAVTSGVAFTRDPSTGGHYYVLNYDDFSGKTDTVTSGSSNNLKIFVHHKSRDYQDLDLWRIKLFDALNELEHLFDHNALDVEFGVNSAGELYIFQVRPLTSLKQDQILSPSYQQAVLQRIEKRLVELSAPHPFLYGRRSVFGVMPDWNPAEIIGVRPKPLALSLYKELVTDNTWAYQRNNYGYKNLRSFPLLINFCGLPYIDVRVSFNSFIPAGINERLADKLVNHYIDSLVEQPRFHDKVEFEIINSCYSLDLSDRLLQLPKESFNANELSDLSNSLRELTNNIIHPETGLWKKDIEKLCKLEIRQAELIESGIPHLDKVYWLLEDCKRYGTLPFAGLARAGFIAVQILRSLVIKDVLSEDEYQAFLASLNTVSSRISKDFSTLPKSEFLRRYGHLRPGTYDILSPSYAADPDRYFDWDQQVPDESPSKPFQMSIDQLNRLDKLLKEHRLEHDVITLFDFIRGAIEGREFGKFIFTRSLSTALDMLSLWSRSNDVSLDDLSYLDYADVRSRYSSSDDPLERVKSSIARGKEGYKVTESLVLPPLIVEAEDLYSFMLPEHEPNFITLQTSEAKVVTELHQGNNLSGKIVMIPNADPGFDWLFSKNIAGLITQYGGVNSHMAIRAGELNIAAVIGCGEQLYQTWAKSNVLQINCALKQVRIIQ